MSTSELLFELSTFEWNHSFQVLLELHGHCLQFIYTYVCFHDPNQLCNCSHMVDRWHLPPKMLREWSACSKLNKVSALASLWIYTLMGFRQQPWRFVMVAMKKPWFVLFYMTSVSVGLPSTTGRLQQVFWGHILALKTIGCWIITRSSRHTSTRMVSISKTLREFAISSKTALILMPALAFAKGMTPRRLILTMTLFLWSTSFPWSFASSIGSLMSRADVWMMQLWTWPSSVWLKHTPTQRRTEQRCNTHSEVSALLCEAWDSAFHAGDSKHATSINKPIQRLREKMRCPGSFPCILPCVLPYVMMDPDKPSPFSFSCWGSRVPLVVAPRGKWIFASCYTSILCHMFMIILYSYCTEGVHFWKFKSATFHARWAGVAGIQERQLGESARSEMFM